MIRYRPLASVNPDPFLGSDRHRPALRASIKTEISGRLETAVPVRGRLCSPGFRWFSTRATRLDEFDGVPGQYTRRSAS